MGTHSELLPMTAFHRQRRAGVDGSVEVVYVNATVKAAASGLLLGVMFAATAVLERDAFIPYSAVAVVSLFAAMIILAAVAFFRRRRPVAMFFFVAGLTFVACFFAAMTVIRK